MATAYIWNGFADYDEIKTYGGMTFRFPFQQVTAIPDWGYKELDHDKSTASEGDEGQRVYKIWTMPGKRIAEEITMSQANRERGIIEIQGKRTGKMIVVPAGVTWEGSVNMVEVPEVEPTRSEKEEAAQLALAFRKRMIEEYFQSKRERISGGKGRIFPSGIVKTFMEELNIEDIDDVMKHQKTGGMDAETLIALVREIRRGDELNGAALREAIDSVRKAGKVQLSKAKPKPSGLGEYKAAYDAAIAAGASPEEAKAAAQQTREEVNV